MRKLTKLASNKKRGIFWSTCNAQLDYNYEEDI